jgi:hypothetical protein
MKRLLTYFALIATAATTAFVLAQETIPEGISEIVLYDWSLLLEVGGLGAFSVLVTKVVGLVLTSRFQVGFGGLLAYATPFVVSTITAVILQISGVLPVESILEALQYGISGGLAAVGLHQGKRQASEALATNAALTRR